MRVSKKIKLDVYACSVHVVITDNMELTSKNICKRHKIPYKYSYCSGITIPADVDTYYVVFDLNVLSHNLISHEVFHLVIVIFEDRGETIKHDNSEPGAYLQGFLSEKIYNFINNKGLTVK